MIKNLPILAVFIILFTFCETKTELEPTIETGVSIEVAKSRKATISTINYQLTFDLLDKNQTKGSLSLGFKTNDLKNDLLLDYTGTCNQLHINGVESSSIQAKNGHIVIPKSELKKGYNELELDFVSDGLGLKRQEDYIYTLFVPNHASSVFPCFDQPDLKGTYQLSLKVPTEWQISSSTNITSSHNENGVKNVTFDQTEKLSTYQFSFVAGNFQKTTHDVGNYQIELLHRENDLELVASNIDAIIKEHAQALAWLESYTGIELPFSKFGLVILPGFPFGGMEHVGAIQYNARNLILSPSASLSEKMRRSKLIAHETAHMWFGNLVTMSWFDDVWVKEVFANFIADKMLYEQYPDVNHDLNFLFSHHPSAYKVDRTSGANAIHQELNNLNNASHMYGAIIYHKAPIMMKQLELFIGEKVLEESLKIYLESYQYSNATWQNLVTILEQTSGKSLVAFNDVWVNEAGMPFIELTENVSPELTEYDIIHHDPSGMDKIWPQYISVTLFDKGDDITKKAFLEKKHFIIPRILNNETAKFILMNSNGQGYGVFSHGLAYNRDQFLFDHARVDLSEYSNDLMRGSSYVNLHEFVLKEGFHPELYFRFLNNYLKSETNELIIKYLLSNIRQIYFRFFNDDMRQRNASYLESSLLTQIDKTPNKSIKRVLFDAYVDLSLTDKSIDNLKQFWAGQGVPEGVELSNMQKETLAINIAFKGKQEDETYIDQQIETMDNEDRIKRLRFIAPSLSHDDFERTSFIKRLQEAKYREVEPWTLTAVSYLHHPYRNETAIDYLTASLELIEQLNETNDIFFIKGWLDNTLRGYQSPYALQIIDNYLAMHPELNKHLSMKVLQSRDMVERAQENLNYYLKE